MSPRENDSALLELARTDKSDASLFVRKAMEASSKSLRVERVSYWEYLEDSSEIVCQDLFIRSAGVHESGLRLSARDYPVYFSVLRECRTMSVDDARADPRTSEFTAGYLLPLGIFSMLDVPVWVNGKFVGIICHEHTGGIRQWNTEEQRFAASIADLVGAALAPRRYRDLADELQRAVRAREEILGIVSHDLKNSLAVVLLGAQSILRYEKNGTLSGILLRKQGEILERSTRQMLSLVENLLDLERCESGAIPLKMVHSHLGEVAREAVRFVEPLAAEKAILIHQKELGSGPELVARCDSERIFQVLHNLLDNAIKFTSCNGTVTVTTEPFQDSVRFSVSDTGRGIPAEELPHVFDRFWQAERQSRAGAGLGLAIANALVRSHGGTLEVTSKLGVGTTFTFTVPRAPVT